MLVSLNWLKELVDIDYSPEEIEEILTNSGTKVETITPLNENTKGIVAGKILKIEKHPQADRLLVCTVDVGEEEPKTIITSATNVFEGALVPVALDGSILGDKTEIKNTEFRGLTSEGMFCSVAELGMNKDLFQKEILEGIYILPEDFVSPGDDLRSPLWIDDQIIDVELTANRGDCQSIYGIAREVAAALDEPIRSIETETEGKIDDISNYLSVKVESDLCPRYTARMFKVNEIKPSPMWMQLKLLNSGVRPINNVVDVTNYVMLEMGQPLHAFDYNSIGTDEIVVKTGNTQETITTLDEKERPITPEMLLITNGKYPIAAAGIMGGLNSEITDDTELIVLESANFDKTSVRLTARKLGLRTESSARYEKGIHPELAEEASKRAAHLFEAIGAATPLNGNIDIKRANSKSEIIKIPISTKWINHFLGINLTQKEIIDYLNRLFLGTEIIDNDQITVSIPDYRLDLRIKEDIAEEVARLYGYNNIQSSLMAGDTFVGQRSTKQQLQEDLTELLIGLGMNQTMTTSFIGPSQLTKLQVSPTEDNVKIINPLGEESSLMRSTLLPQQLEIVSLNHHHGLDEGAFFEIQKTYHENDKEELPEERVDLVLTEYGKTSDYFSLKGKIEAIFNLFGIKNYNFKRNTHDIWHPGRSAQIFIGNKLVGEMGEIHPHVVENYDLPKRVYAAEISFNALLEAYNKRIEFKELPKYPSIERDLALVIDEVIPAGNIRESIISNANNLEDIQLFDVYTGQQVPENKKSLAYRLIFRHPGQTLTDEEVDSNVKEILKALEKDFEAVLRA